MRTETFKKGRGSLPTVLIIFIICLWKKHSLNITHIRFVSICRLVETFTWQQTCQLFTYAHLQFFSITKLTIFSILQSRSVKRNGEQISIIFQHIFIVKYLISFSEKSYISISGKCLTYKFLHHFARIVMPISCEGNAAAVLPWRILFFPVIWLIYSIEVWSIKPETLKRQWSLMSVFFMGERYAWRVCMGEERESNTLNELSFWICWINEYLLDRKSVV